MNIESSLFERIAELYNESFNDPVQRLLNPLYEKYRSSIDGKAIDYAQNKIRSFTAGLDNQLITQIFSLHFPYFEVRASMTGEESRGFGFDHRYGGPFLDVSFDAVQNHAFGLWPHNPSTALNEAYDDIIKSAKKEYIQMFAPELIQFARDTGFPVVVIFDNFENEMVVGDLSLMHKKQPTFSERHCYLKPIWDKSLLRLDQAKGDYSVLAIREWNDAAKSWKLVK